MSRNVTGGKREREAKRDRRKTDKADRLRRNREQALRGGPPIGGDDLAIDGMSPQSLPEVDLADVVIGVAPRPKREPMTPAKLFVGGLSWETTTEELQIAFANFGRVTDAAVICDRSTGRSRGFGFVTFEKHADADAAIKQMDGRELDGRPLKVNRAEPS
jgi:hypothetical protein